MGCASSSEVVMMGPPQEAKASAMAMSHSSKIRVPPVPPTTASSSPLLLLDELDHLVALASINSASSPPHSHAGQDRDEPKEHGHVEHASATTHDRSSRTPRDVLSQLNHLETRGPQSWLEVSGVLETLKPHQDLQSGKHAPSDSIDIHEVMKGLDDDDHDSYDNRKEGTGHIKMKHSTGRRHGTKPFDKSMIIHTLEELDGAGSFQQGKEKGVEVKKGVQDQNTRKGGSITKVEDRLSSIPKKGVGIPGSHGSVDLMGKVSMARKNNPSNGDFDVEYLGSYTNKASADHMISEPGNRVSTKISIRNVQADRPAQEEEEEEEKEVVNSENNEHSLVEDISMKQGHLKSDLLGDERTYLVESPKSLVSERSMTGSNANDLIIGYEDFEIICPPGGERSVVLYTTSMRGMRKAYEDCIKVRGIIERYRVGSSGVVLEERDVSLHLEYRNELRELLQKVVTVPRLFIKGRYIGGVEKISTLVEQGKLQALLNQGR